ncbi:bacteriohemerythrin [Candidatus Albibeggiatoa sp. nov. NOAA]|uniref:bacteriohemerythrin n=1 Tax=Candidatus Albibeggiatoa sp. nov. NOAA TaxID=3162724 RepID=UPI0032F2EBCD|nr:bacteriohemerythrin [Thiotrichaceae bacterium]
MALMEWTEALQLGLADIDAQHKKLVDIINQLDDAINAGQDSQALGDILGSLLDCAKSHFSFEEKMLQDHGYKAYPSHKAEHEAVIEKLGFMHQAYIANQAPDNQQVLMFLKIWLEDHIMETDKAYVASIS